MNKKLVLLALPAMLLASCGGPKEITLAEAKQVGKGIAESTISAAKAEEFTIVAERTATVKASSSAIGGIGAASGTYSSGAIVQYSKAEKYLHYEGSDKSGTMEVWYFVQGGFYYELLRDTTGKKTGYKYPVTAEEAAKIDVLEEFGAQTILSWGGLTYFTALLIDLETREESAGTVSGVTEENKYYSNGDGHLVLDYNLTYANGEYEGAEIDGTATGTQKMKATWENYLPVSLENSADVTVNVDFAGQTASYQETLLQTVYAQYSGIMISRPSLSSFTYLNVNE